MSRTLPQSADAESFVIGACLQNHEAAETALLLLQPQHFFLSSNQRSFSAIRDLYAEEQAIDIATVLRRLDATHSFEQLPAWMGGEEGARTRAREQLALQVAVTNTWRNVADHCRIVREMWGKRRLIELFSPPMSGVWNGARPDVVIREVEKAVIAAHSDIEDEGTTSVVSAFQAAEWLQAHVQSPPGPRDGVGTPWRFLGRFQPGRLYVLGGYPKDGKTAISVQFLRAACEEGRRVGYFSVEMSWQDLAMRVASSFGVSYSLLQTGRLGPALIEPFEHAVEEIARWQDRLAIIDDAAPAASDIVRHQRLGRYEYIIIDYLQRMPYRDRLELNATIKAITTLARKAQIPVLLLSQFSRPPNPTGNRPFPRPTMSMFAETSVIEKEASMAISIWRPRDEQGNPGERAELNVMANRYGQPGIHEMHFRGDEQRFVEVDHFH